ncbi:MAG: YciI family protein [Bacteroidota bacterium]
MENPEDNPAKAIGYDSVKAKAYGADQYGMKSYVMAFLKAGPNRDLDADAAAELQKAHLKNIGRMAKEGKLLIAGPFLDNGDIRGIYIFDVPTIEEAEALTNTDPAIQAGSLVMELKPWYGSAALMAVNDIHSTLQRQSITGE